MPKKYWKAGASTRISCWKDGSKKALPASLNNKLTPVEVLCATNDTWWFDSGSWTISWKTVVGSCSQRWVPRQRRGVREITGSGQEVVWRVTSFTTTCGSSLKLDWIQERIITLLIYVLACKQIIVSFCVSLAWKPQSTNPYVNINLFSRMFLRIVHVGSAPALSQRSFSHAPSGGHDTARQSSL